MKARFSILAMLPIVLMIIGQHALSLMYIPVLRAHELQYDYWLFIYAFIVGTTIVQLLTGRIVDKVKIKNVSILAALLIAASLFFLPFLSLKGQYFLRICQVIPASLLSLVGRVYMSQTFDEALIRKAIPWVVMSTSVAPIAAPLMGITLHRLGGLSLVHSSLGLFFIVTAFAAFLFFKAKGNINSKDESAQISPLMEVSGKKLLQYLVVAYGVFLGFDILLLSELAKSLTLMDAANADSHLTVLFWTSEAGVIVGALWASRAGLSLASNLFKLVLPLGFAILPLLIALALGSSALILVPLIFSLFAFQSIIYSVINSELILRAKTRAGYWSSLANVSTGSFVLIGSYALEHDWIVSSVFYGVSALLLPLTIGIGYRMAVTMDAGIASSEFVPGSL